VIFLSPSSPAVLFTSSSAEMFFPNARHILFSPTFLPFIERPARRSEGVATYAAPAEGLHEILSEPSHSLPNYFALSLLGFPVPLYLPPRDYSPPLAVHSLCVFPSPLFYSPGKSHPPLWHPLSREGITLVHPPPHTFGPGYESLLLSPSCESTRLLELLAFPQTPSPRSWLFSPALNRSYKGG